MHLHHRLLGLGHSHRRAVAIMYVWTAVFAFGVSALVVWSTTEVLVCFGVGVVVATLLTLGPLRGRSTPPPADPGGAPDTGPPAQLSVPTPEEVR